SIAAGLQLLDLEKSLGESARVIRVMPNTPALVGKGASAFSRGTRATDDDADFVTNILGSVGKVLEVPENQIDAITGLSGSGPAYIYTIIEALADGGVLVGLPKDKSLLLAAQTVAGAAEMVLQTKEHPASLRDQVTSPGGTTIAGLAALESGKLRATLIEAVKAATLRSEELGES
ncbi:pyrroline-5-carboxylate reductase, partial [Verrucomicrobiales bacterium]|nr:pyrroline-5-carboxylate reductase [Verrucomicrobiales bacterium]